MITFKKKIQIKLKPEQGYAKIFNENEDLGELEYKRNVKSNLIINLEKFNYEKRKLLLFIIGNYELRIADLEKKNENYNEVYDALFSGIHSFLRLNQFEIAYNIALKSLMDTHFSKKIKIKMLILIKDGIFKSNFRYSYDFFKYIIDQYKINRYPLKLQNINKLPLYLFNKLDFRDIKYPNLNPYEISIYPIYSKEYSKHLEVLERFKAFKKENKVIIPQSNYNIIKGGSNAFEFFIKKENNRLLSKINNLIKEFSNWSSKEINKWEKEISLLNYFSTGEIIF